MLTCVAFNRCRYLPELTLSENINLPPTLLSRFDLVYLVLDKHDEERDRKLAKHLVSLFWADAPEQTQPVSVSAEPLTVGDGILPIKASLVTALIILDYACLHRCLLIRPGLTLCC